MADIGDIRIVLDLDDGEMRVRLQRAGVAVREFERSVDGSLRTLDGLNSRLSTARERFRDFVVTAALIRGAITTIREVTVDWMVAIGDATGRLEKLRAMMAGFSTQSTEQARQLEAATNVDYLIKLSKTVPFAMDQIANSFAKMKSVGLDPMGGALDALTNAISKFGGGDQELQRASVAITQMAGKGVISMEELRQQLGEAVPTALRSMADALNMTVAELVKKVSLGQVEATSALKKFFVQVQLESQGANARMMNTWSGMISRLKTEWQLFLVRIGESKMAERLKETVQRLIDLMTGPAFQRAAIAFGETVNNVLKGLLSLADMVSRNWDKIVVVAKIGTAVVGLRVLASAIGTVSAAAGGLAGATSAIANLSAVGTGAFGVLAGTLVVMASGAAKAGVAFTAFGNAIASGLATMFGASAAAGVATASVSRFGTAAAGATRIVSGLAGALRGVAGLAISAGVAITAFAANALGLGGVVAMFARATRVIAEMRLAAGGAAMAMSLLGPAVAGATPLVALLGAAFSALIGPITLLLAGGTALYFYFDGQAKAARKLTDEILETKGALADLGQMEKLVAEQRSANAAYLVARDRAQRAEITGRGVEKARKELEEALIYQDRVRNAMGLAYDAVLERSTRAFLDAKNKEIEIELSNSAVRFVNEQNSLNERRELLTKAEYERQKLALVGDNFDRKIATIRAAEMQAQIELQDRLNKAKTGDFSGEKREVILPDGKRIQLTDRENNERELRQFKALVNDYRAQLVSLEEQKDAALSTLAEPVKLFDSKGDSQGKAIDSLLEQVLRRAEQLKGELSAPGSSGYLESIKQQLRETGVAMDNLPPKARQILEAAAFVEKAEAAEKFSKGFEDLWGEIDKTANSLAGLNVKAEEWNTKVKEGALGPESLISPAMRRSLDEAIALYGALNQADTQAKKARAGLDELRTAAIGLRDELMTPQERVQAMLQRDLAKFQQVVTAAAQAEKTLGTAIANYQANTAQRMADRAARLAAAGSDAERQRIQSQIDLEEEKYQQLLAMAETFGIERQQIEESFRQYSVARTEKAVKDMAGPMAKLNIEWQNMFEQVGQAIVNAANKGTEAFINFAKTGKFEFSSLVDSILEDMLRIAVQRNITGPLAAGLESLIGIGAGLLFGGGTAPTTTSAAAPTNVAPIAPIPFAKGGVMTPFGPADVKAYATGGIRGPRDPAVAIFGEGDMSEAYVPLPDGRTIPVTMTGASASPNVTVNVINQTGQAVEAEQGSPRFDGKQFVLDVVLSASKKPGSFRDEMRGAMRS